MVFFSLFLFRVLSRGPRQRENFSSLFSFPPLNFSSLSLSFYLSLSPHPPTNEQTKNRTPPRSWSASNAPSTTSRPPCSAGCTARCGPRCLTTASARRGWRGRATRSRLALPPRLAPAPRLRLGARTRTRTTKGKKQRQSRTLLTMLLLPAGTGQQQRLLLLLRRRRLQQTERPRRQNENVKGGVFAFSPSSTFFPHHSEL